MSELHAALGNVALERFPAQTKEREEMLGYLEESLSEIPGVRMLRRDPRHTTRSFSMYGFAIDPKQFGGERLGVVAALEAEGIPAEGGYEAMNRYTLFQPTISRLAVPSAFPEAFDYSKVSMPEAERGAEVDSIWLDHEVFSAGPKGIDDMAAALRKVQDQHAELSKWVEVQKASGRHH
jgi:dTDP-4-amino-4,6-dideoxygalactose transaminase